MSLYASKDVKVEFDNASGSLVDISNIVTKISGIDVEIATEKTTAFGDTWEENLPTGNKSIKDITLEGFYDDATGGEDEIFVGASTETRTFKITYGGSKTTSLETCIASYARTPEMMKFTKFKVTLKPSGPTTEV